MAFDLEKYKTISVSKHATPSRSGANRVIKIDHGDAQLSDDVAAYKRLRADGLQPPQIDGSAEREKFPEAWAIEERPPDWQVEQAGNDLADI
jgi:hypothetical protein